MTTVYDVVVGQQIRSRNHHGTDFVQGYDKRPELIAAFQDTHHHIVFLNTDSCKVRHDVVAHSLHVGKRIVALLALVVRPKQGQFIGLLLSPTVHHVIREVEAFGNDELEILLKVLHAAE